MTKPTWDEYYTNIARAASIRSSCIRSKVGACVVKDNHVVSLGYNDTPAGEPGCESCPRSQSGCAPGASYDDPQTRCHAIHAESNALLHADRSDLSDATLYITREPCFNCERLIRGAGVGRVVVDQEGGAVEWWSSQSSVNSQENIVGK